jgi:LytR cell envelope-related transcriptional attenuator
MHRVQEIGAYAGFAAVIGLAVLSALYFSQARDVKRLREWAGRAPERAAEEEARIAAASATAQQQQRAAAGGGGGVPTVAPQPTTLPGTGSTTPAPGALPPPRPAPTMASAPSTPILSRPAEPWYKRVVWPAPRYIALIVAGVLVVGGGAAYGIAHLVNGGGNGGTPNHTATSPPSNGSSTTKTAKAKRKPAAPLSPSKITVAVLNGTTITGLASQTADKLQQQGFVRGNTSNALTQGQQAQSVVEYSGNNSRAARLVANRLGIADTEPIDAQTQAKAGDATVTVIIGADKAATGTG